MKNKQRMRKSRAWKRKKGSNMTFRPGSGPKMAASPSADVNVQALKQALKMIRGFFGER